MSGETLAKVLRRFPQHFDVDTDPQDVPDGAVALWGDRCCGLACLRSVIHAHRLPVPAQSQMLRDGLAAGAYCDKGWIHAGLVELGRSYGLDGAVGAVSGVGGLVRLVEHEVLPVVSSTIGFPVDGRTGGHLVVFAGVSVVEGQDLVHFVDPSRWGATHDSVPADRFWASCTGRVIALWRASAGPPAGLRDLLGSGAGR